MLINNPFVRPSCVTVKQFVLIGSLCHRSQCSVFGSSLLVLLLSSISYEDNISTLPEVVVLKAYMTHECMIRWSMKLLAPLIWLFPPRLARGKSERSEPLHAFDLVRRPINFTRAGYWTLDVPNK